MATRDCVIATHRRFCNILPVSGLQHCSHQGLDATDLTHEDLVVLIVARQVAEDASGACHHVYVVRLEDLNQHVQQRLHVMLLKRPKGIDEKGKPKINMSLDQQIIIQTTNRNFFLKLTILVAASDKFLSVHRQF